MFNPECRRRHVHLSDLDIAGVYKIGGSDIEPNGGHGNTAQSGWQELRLLYRLPYLCFRSCFLVIIYDYLPWPGHSNSLELHLPLCRYLARYWRTQNCTLRSHFRPPLMLRPLQMGVALMFGCCEVPV
ncbi:hypothetical protein GYMLUDRAFT_916620 [Collybiopsis luxurians FD-317 M1]|uniref:Uncharacterized protein n=1 Tax=Collybiopsis luxurians FD-317 M1 TaxID=944289 RepID=A0A0D0AUM5_9AGAR|nr:hypothetical protein GYMLUDRAFT_916620 [Collybiopsis luxurians FD-317 M1]